MKATKVWFADDKIFIETDAGKQLWQSLLWYPRLKDATEAQRLKYRLSPCGIHWEELDEDVSFESFTYEEPEPVNPIAQAFKTIPFINVSQFARMINIPQSVMASYIAGRKKPSEARRREIEAALHRLGHELTTISIR